MMRASTLLTWLLCAVVMCAVSLAELGPSIATWYEYATELQKQHAKSSACTVL